MHQKLIDFLFANWETIAGAGSTLGFAGGWLSERKKRLRDNRDSDVAFWNKTIEAQNAYIEKLEQKIDLMESRYEHQIQGLLSEVADLSNRLEHYEPRSRRKPVSQPAKPEQENA